MPNFLDAVDCASRDESAWSAIVQDDADPIGDDWQGHLDLAVRFSPCPVLCLTHFGAATDRAFRHSVPYMVGPHLVWGAAVAYRHDFLVEIGPWAREVYDATGYPHDDRLVSAFANKQGLRTALLTRAIFDQPVEKSLVGHGGQNRRPNHRIDDGRRPNYMTVPRALTTKSGAAPDQREWLAAWGTPDEDPEFTFKVIRNGAVRRVRKDAA